VLAAFRPGYGEEEVVESGGLLSLVSPVGDSAESGVVEAWLLLAVCTKAALNCWELGNAGISNAQDPR
jgi:hypothetical protein